MADKKIVDFHSRNLLGRFIDRVLDFWERWKIIYEGFVPSTPLNILNHDLDKGVHSILDLGCGKGDPMLFINRKKRFSTVGADIFLDYLREARAKGGHDNYVKCDIRRLPFKAHSFDTVLCLRVIEHLEKQEGIELLAEMERIACREVALIAPAGSFKQSPFDNNSYQEHRYIWDPEEFRGLGYEVRLNGIRGFKGDTANMTRFKYFWSTLGDILWVFSRPILFIAPGLAANMVLYKRVRGDVVGAIEIGQGGGCEVGRSRMLVR
jgi:SAM-dependent methyltransferase